MDTKTKGSVAELVIASHLMRIGWRVLFPFGENNRYDLAAERDGRFLRIQVKYVTPKNGVLEVNCRSSNNWSVLHYSAQEIDLIAVYDSVNFGLYFIPVKSINRNSFKIRLDIPKNSQRTKIHLAKDFLTIE